MEGIACVVICFHFIIFEPSETTLLSVTYCHRMLWFAFISLSLSHQKQPSKGGAGKKCVVICFHFIIFEPSETTSSWPGIRLCLLWFAFISLSLSHQKQHEIIEHIDDYVVICFHFIIFEPSETTVALPCSSNSLLWFAFISLSLSHQKQPKEVLSSPTARCDLLSFHYLWAIRNNRYMRWLSVVCVVICFHFIIFEPSETTYSILSVVYKRITDGNRI